MAESGVCTNCGAALPPADVLGLITCSGCGRVTKLPGSTPTLDPEDIDVAEAPGSPAPAPDQVPPVMPPLQGWPAPPVAAPAPGGQWAAPAAVAGAPPGPPPTSPPGSGGKGRKGKRSSGSEASTARRIGCAVVPIGIVMAISFGVFGAIRSCDISTTTSGVDPFEFDSSKLTLAGSGTVLPATGDDADVVMLLQSNEDAETTRHVARIAFTGDRSELVWQSEALPDDSYRSEIAVVDDTLFAGVDDEVYALDAKTGETKWKATLRDKLTSGCETCFAAVRGRLMVRTTDAYITAFGTQGPEPLWSKRLNSTQGSMSVVGDRLFVVDDGEGDDAPVPVSLVDPANGKTIRATTPRCPKGLQTPWDLAISAGDRIRAVPGSSDVFAIFGFGDGCVVRWAPESGAIKWTSRLDGLGSFDQDEVLTGERDLVIGTTGSPIVTVYLPNGKARVLDEASGDVDAQPSQIVGRTLVALTVTTRGTPKGGLAAWDLSTGVRTWSNTSLGTAQPATSRGSGTSDALFDGTPRSLLVPVGDGLNVFVFEGTERTFSVSPLDLASGELGTEVRRAFFTRYDTGTVSLTVEGQAGDRLIVSIDNLLQSLPVSGKGDIVSYPEKD